MQAPHASQVPAAPAARSRPAQLSSHTARRRHPGPRTRAGKEGQGGTWLRGPRAGRHRASRTGTFPAERYARIARRRGKAKAQAAARSSLVIAWHLLADPAARYTDLGYGCYTARLDKDRRFCDHIRRIQVPGFTVTLTRTACMVLPRPQQRLPLPGQPGPGEILA
jgi:hypothetical protein